jgi:cytochrome c6
VLHHAQWYATRWFNSGLQHDTNGFLINPSEEGYITENRRRAMKKSIILATLALSITVLASSAFAAGGEETFKAKCASCHPDGGNIMNPKETLKGLKDSKKIVAKIRKGGGGMTAFDAKAISDADAKLLADYIIKTFKK